MLRKKEAKLEWSSTIKKNNNDTVLMSVTFVIRQCFSIELREPFGFQKMDCKVGYWQIKTYKESSALTACKALQSIASGQSYHLV